MKKVFLAVFLSLFVCGIANAANITGVWQGVWPEGDYDYNVEMTLKQTGKRIKGSMVIIKSASGMWSVKGRIDGNEISLTFTNISGDYFGGDYTGTIEGDVMYFSSSLYSYSYKFGRIYECKEVK